MKVAEVLAWVDGIAPFATACDFDNVGLLVGDPEAPVHRIGLALDCTNSLVEEAAAQGVDLILTHHPVIFHPLKQVTAESPVYRMIQKGISCIAAHTNLDRAPGGTNDQLVLAMGLQEADAPAFLEGLGRTGVVEPPVSVRAFAQKLKDVSGATAVRYYDAGHPVRRLAVVAGSGGSELPAVLAEGYDTFVTGDIKQDQFVLAENRGINLIEWNHYDAEHLVLKPLKARLEAAFAVPVLVLREENAVQSV